MDNINEYNNKDSIIFIMAGGLGTRMNSELPKVLHIINNKPMIVHVIETALILNSYKICIIVGKFYQLIYETIKKYIDNNVVENMINFIEQNKPLGTGHAIMCANNFLSKTNINIVKVAILSGDVPFIKANTINKLLQTTITCNVLIANYNDPHGYGRIKHENYKIIKIIEEKDCNNEEKKITLINSGIYTFNIQILLKYINKIDNNNNQKEYYLTQIFEILNKNNIPVGYNIVTDNNEIMGINTQEQLIKLEAEYLR